MEVALSLEAAQKNVQTLRGSEVPQLHKLDRRRPTEKKSPKERSHATAAGGRGTPLMPVGLDKPSASTAVKVGTLLASAEVRKSRQQQTITPWKDPMGRHRDHRTPGKQ